MKFQNDDFQVYKSIINGRENYHISVEGYMGADKLDDIISWYRDFLKTFNTYLIENNIKQTERYIWKRIYTSRQIEVCHDHDCYWVFLDGYKSDRIWDLYYYMEDVINQLIEFNSKLK